MKIVHPKMLQCPQFYSWLHYNLTDQYPLVQLFVVLVHFLVSLIIFLAKFTIILDIIIGNFVIRSSYL
eukprot:UN22524